MTSQDLSRQLEQIISDQISRFNEFSSEQWNEKPSPAKWSKKEILGHLADSAINNIHRFVRVQYDDQTNIYYDQDFWVAASDYQSRDLLSIIQLWQHLNLHIAQLWSNIPDDQLAKTIPVKDEHPTLKFLMEDYIDHLNHHLMQIFR